MALEQQTPLAMEAMTVAKGALAVAGAAAAVLIRLTGADHEQHRWRFVVADIFGTLGLFYLCLLLALGLGANFALAVALAGVGAAAGWATVFGLLRAYAARKGG